MSGADVTGKHILITGAGSGIGAASARLLAARGAKVGLADIAIDAAQALSEELNSAGGDTYAYRVDVADRDSVDALFSHAVGRVGTPDVVLNNAGIDHFPAPMHEVPDEALMRNLAVNLHGVWFCMKRAIPLMLANGGGHIINVASVAGLRSAPSVSAYAAAKHGVVGLSKTAAVEYARQNIRVNAVCPSFVDTPMVQGILSKMDESWQRKIIGANPMKRLGKVEEIAAAVAWLCSDESSFMTGQSVVLDGGMLA